MPSSAGVGAPYGHACANCALSKCKCIIQKIGEPCERCHRMSKTCRPAETVRRRNMKQRAVSKSTRIEDKLDGLVSLIRSGVQTESDITSTASIRGAMAGTYRSCGDRTASLPERNSVSRNPNDYHYDYPHTIPALTPSSTGSTSSLLNIVAPTPRDPCDFSTAEAEDCLINFRTFKLKYFPCVHIPPDTTAQQLHDERPFLWLSIMRLGSKSTSRQQSLANKIRQVIAQAMVVESEKHIDLLLGLLVFMGWANYQLLGKSFLSLFSQLATSLVYDLGINKPISTSTEAVTCSHKYSKALTCRTMEHRRAVLACYLLTSMYSSYPTLWFQAYKFRISYNLHKIDPLPWTTHMDECLEVLDDSNECPNDNVLVQQVRLQRIADQTYMQSSPNNKSKSAEPREPGSQGAETIDPGLLSLKTTILNGPRDNDAVVLHLYITELNSMLAPVSTYNNKLPLHPLKSLTAGLQAIRSWFDFFFTIPPAAYVGFTFAIYSQLLECLTTLYRLTTLKVAYWNTGAVRETTDLLPIIDRIINTFEQVSVLAGLDNTDAPDGDLFFQTSQICRSLRRGWEAELAPDRTISAGPAEENIAEGSLSDILGVEFFDNEWLMDLLIPPTY